MSIEAVKKFRTTVNENPSLQETMLKLTDGEGNLLLPEIIKLGAQHGFEITEADIEALYSNDNDELSDFELEMVSAGVVMKNSGANML